MTLLVALYTVAAHASKRHTWLAVGVLETGALLASARWSS